jgi:hypothetical protein
MINLEYSTALRQKFMDEVDDYRAFDAELRVIVVAVQFPNGSVETIINHGNEQVRDKMRYYAEKYDDHFGLKANPDIRIVGYMIV